MKTSRRSFLLAGAATGGLLAVGGGTWYLGTPGPEAIGRHLVGYLGDHDRAEALGAAYLAAEPPWAAMSLADSVTTLLDALPCRPESLSRASWEALDQALASRITNDYESERVRVLGLWILSETEAKLCGLYHLHRERLGLG